MNALPTSAVLTALNVAILTASAVHEGTPRGAEPRVLRGSALELVDQRGTVRARLDVEPEGGVVLRLLDQTGTIRVKLAADRDGSGLLLANDATEPGVHLLARPEGSTVRVVNKDGRERVIAPD